MKMTMEEAPDFVPLPADSVITVRIEEINLREVTTRDGRTFEKLGFTFHILSVDAVGDGGNVQDYATLVGGTIFGSVSARFTTATENKLRQWVSAILNMELEAGFELDTDLLIGRKVRALTSQYTKKGFSTPSHQVESLVPIVGEIPTAAPARELAAPF